MKIFSLNHKRVLSTLLTEYTDLKQCIILITGIVDGSKCYFRQEQVLLMKKNLTAVFFQVISVLLILK